jgi:hypothetical protein
VMVAVFAAVVVLFRLTRPPHDFAASLAGIWPDLGWIALSYLGAFATAGALVGIVNRLGLGLLRVPLTAFVAGASIYGVIGLAMHLFSRDDPPSLALVAGLSASFGAIWALVASINELRSRRRRWP